jgi:hypothetical protein
MMVCPVMYPQAVKVAQLPISPNGRSVGMLLSKFRLSKNRGSQFRWKKTWAYRIAGDAFGRPSLRDCSRQLNDPPFTGSVGRAIGKCTPGLERGQIDDPPVTLRSHLWRKGLT